MTIKKIKDCFANAFREEKKGMKHKGLLPVKPNREEAEEYIHKAKKNLELCYFYKDQGFDYKIPEEWFYTLYYCALAILCMFGVESRSQKCTVLFLRYVKDKGLIEYDDQFIDRIMVHKAKDALSDVDAREKSRYSSLIHMKEVLLQYDEMLALCKKAIAQCEEIVFSKQEYQLPSELIKSVDAAQHN